tara:strand:- start:522 stop:1118 length:597 start_codon:yes stop_codon:yes gene_type:complete
MRQSLSTQTDGSFLPLDVNTSTLIHRAQDDVNEYVRVIGFNRGKRVRNVCFIFNDTEAVYTSVQPTGNAQILLPDIPLYNAANGIEIYAALKQPISAWNIPDSLDNLIILDNGKVAGLVISNITASSGAQPLLIHVQDSRRSHTDIDPTKGAEAILEIFSTNGSVAVEIINPGHSLVNGHIQSSLHSGVYFYGDIFIE